MTSTTSTNTVPREIGLALVAPPDSHIPPELPVSGLMRKPIYLDRGNVLRILDGRGTQLTSPSGVLWITEEGCANDNVLLPGASHRIENAGTALVSAHRPTCVVLEVPAGASPPHRVDLASADGEPGRRIAFGPGNRLPLGALTAAIGAAIRSVVATGRKFWTRRKPPIPTGGWFQHDSVHSSRCIRHSRSGLGTPPWNEPSGNARNAMSRHCFFPYY